MQTFECKTEYIELYKLLKVAGMVDTGGMAKMVILDELVMVDGQIETRKACKIRPGQVVEFNGEAVEVAAAQ